MIGTIGGADTPGSEAGTATKGRRQLVLRWIDAVAIAAIALALLELAIVTVVKGRSPFGGTISTLVGVLGLSVVIVGALLGLRGRLGARARIASRLMVYCAVGAALSLFWTRWPKSLRPRPTDEVITADSALQRLTVDQRLRWAVRVAGHAVSAGGQADSILNVPRTWPFPPNAAIRAHDLTDSVVVSADEGTGRACHFTLYRRALPPQPRAGRHDPVRCDPTRAVNDGRPLTVRRTNWSVPLRTAIADVSDGSRWMQYRHDASRSGSVGTGLRRTSGWRTTLDGEVRSTPSVVAGRVLIGTHGPGALHAFDSESGRPLWRQYEPNWIHQDAVSDGQTVVVGFGDNAESLYGESPGGVSAFSLRTGALLWSAFEGSSVMTSPVLWRDAVAYITSTGTMILRDLSSGAETGRIRLPGRATMAPPALRGDTVVAALDSELVCALLLPTLDRLWCTSLPGAGMLGHSSPTVIGNRVYVSGGIVRTGGRFGMSWWTWLRVRTMLAWIGPNATDFEYEGQRLWALDLATGTVEWQSKIYPSAHGPGGHVSGTASGEDGVGVVLLPLAGKMVSFDLQSGRELWIQEVGPSRGPVAHTGNRLILTLRSGELRVVRARSGATDCSIRTSLTFDRAGPAVADSTLFFGSQSGILVAMPVGMLTSCQSDQVRAILE